MLGIYQHGFRLKDIALSNSVTRPYSNSYRCSAFFEHLRFYFHDLSLDWPTDEVELVKDLRDEGTSRKGERCRNKSHLIREGHHRSAKERTGMVEILGTDQQISAVGLSQSGFRC